MKSILIAAALLAVLLAIPATADAGFVLKRGPLDGHRAQRVKQATGKVVRATGRGVAAVGRAVRCVGGCR